MLPLIKNEKSLHDKQGPLTAYCQQKNSKHHQRTGASILSDNADTVLTSDYG